MKLIYIFLLPLLLLAGCSSGTDSVSEIDNIQSIDAESITNESEIANNDCVTCIDPPGSGNPPSCTPPDEYRLEASINNYGAYAYDSDIPTWRIMPLWGGITQDVLNELEDFEQNSTNLLDSSPYHETFEMDYKVKAKTTVKPNGKLAFRIHFYDIKSKLWFQRTSIWSSNAIVTFKADEFQLDGEYSLSNDSFTVTGYEFEGLNTNVDISGVAPMIDAVMCFFSIHCGVSGAEGSVENIVRNKIESKINGVNRNSPNMFLRSLIGHPEVTGVLQILDDAILELLNDDVSGTLDIELPSCGDIDRNGLIELEITTS